jgi:predicted ester cyclase
VRVTVQGTHGGAFLGIAPTGRRAEFIGLQRMRFQDGRISRIVWHHYDKLRMLKQLGVVDLPPQIAGT